MTLFISNYLGTGPSILEMLSRILLTVLFAGIIGMNRQLKGKVAGITTHLMVALGACAIAILQDALYLDTIQRAQELIQQGTAVSISVENQRVISAVVTGVGFLGAGAILKTKNHISGLTTASTLWIVAIIGIIFGMGYYVLGGIIGLFAIFGLIFLRNFLSRTGLEHPSTRDVETNSKNTD